MQQALPTDALGEFWQLASELRRDAGEFRSVRGCCHQHQIPQDAGESLQHGARIASAIQQAAAGFHQLQGVTAGQGFGEGNQVLFRNGTKQIPHRIRFDRSR